MEKKPVIFLSNFHPFVSRNIFDTGVLKGLSERSEKIVVFVLKHKEEYLKSLYEKDNITIIGMELKEIADSKRERFLSRIAELLLDTNTKHLHQKLYRSHTGKHLKYFFSVLVMKTLGHSVTTRRIFRRLVLALSRVGVFDEFFERYTPDIVIATDPFSPYDILLMKDARKYKNRLIGLIRSWDNFTTKEYLQVKPDEVIVQNQDMLMEGANLHDLEHFSVVGIPQFEYYLKYEPRSRAEFCTRMGLDPEKRTVLFSPAGKKFSSTDWQICELLRRLQEAGSLPSDLQFIIRLHPMNKADLSKFTPPPHFVIDDPASSFENSRAKESEMGTAEVDHLIDSLYHSDVILNSVSSLIIDAAIFDKPVITISFDGWEKNVPITESVLSEQGNEWLQVLLQNGLSPKAENPEEMAELIRMYLNNPSKDSEKRKEFVQHHCYGLDGKSVERIIQSIFP